MSSVHSIMIKRILLPLSLLSSTLLLTGCDSVRNTFGLDHYQPNEMDVSNHPPLSLPKDFKLRPPVTGGASNTTSSSISSSPQAQKVLVGDTAQTVGKTGDASESALLSQASGNQSAPADIRKLVDSEAAVDGNVSDSLMSRILSWKDEAAKNFSSISSDAAKTETSEKTKATAPKPS